MTAHEFWNVFEAVTGFAFLWVVCLHLWPCYRLDSFRQKVFAVRDELFDYANGGHISFNDPAYILLRKSMNGFIRYGHNITFSRFLCTILSLKIMGRDLNYAWSVQWYGALKSVPKDEVRDKLLDLHQKTMALVLERLVTGSPFLISAVLAVSIISVLHRGLKGIRVTLFGSASRIVDTRILQEEAARA